MVPVLGDLETTLRFSDSLGLTEWKKPAVFIARVYYSEKIQTFTAQVKGA